MEQSEELVRKIMSMREEAGSAGNADAVQKEAESVEITYTEPTEIPDGYRAYSELFGNPTSGREYAIPVYSREDWPEWARVYIPQPDDNYVFPPEQTEVLVTGVDRGKRAQLLHGPKGSGKSTLGEQVAARMNIPFIRVNMSEDAESSRIFGTVDIQEGSTVWVPGPAELAATVGNMGCFLQIDEVSATPPGINLAMQWMLERDGKLFIADKPGREDERQITPGPMFRVFCTDNTQLQGDTTGHYSGTNVQSEAFIDRMASAIYLGYLSEDHERQIITNKVPKLPRAWLRAMVTFAGLVRGSYDSGDMQYTMSPRALIDWAEESMFWGDLKRGFKVVFYDKLIPEDQEVVANHWKNAVGDSL